MLAPALVVAVAGRIFDGGAVNSAIAAGRDVYASVPAPSQTPSIRYTDRPEKQSRIG